MIKIRFMGHLSKDPGGYGTRFPSRPADGKKWKLFAQRLFTRVQKVNGKPRGV
jgi:hypothetical protein